MLRSGYQMVFSLGLLTLTALASAYVYFHYVRPRLLAAGCLDFEARWSAWLRNRWDLVIAASINVLAASWNSLLDFAVLFINHGPDIFDGIKGQVDLTAAWIPGWLQVTIQIMTVLITIIRAVKLTTQAQT